MDVNGWDVDVVPDDFHHFMKCFFKKDGHFRLVPIFMLTGNNAQEHTNWFSAMRSRYRRAKRDAWGAIDLSYILSQWYQKRNVLDKHGAFMLFVDVIEHHVSWSSYFLTVMLGGMMSAWLNPELETYPFGIGIRAMALIDDLEPDRRGIYAGAVGYISAAGDLDTCIALRTAILKDGQIHVQAGGGVVLDSDPQYEFEETMHKAGALQRAADLAAIYEFDQ